MLLLIIAVVSVIWRISPNLISSLGESLTLHLYCLFIVFVFYVLILLDILKKNKPKNELLTLNLIWWTWTYILTKLGRLQNIISPNVFCKQIFLHTFIRGFKTNVVLLKCIQLEKNIFKKNKFKLITLTHFVGIRADKLLIWIS